MEGRWVRVRGQRLKQQLEPEDDSTLLYLLIINVTGNKMF